MYAMQKWWENHGNKLGNKVTPLSKLVLVWYHRL